MRVEARHILVSGIVQGVGFRYWVERNARELGLGGWARNLYDGRVEILAEGAEAALEQLVELCRRGPRAASVSDVRTAAAPAAGARDFEIRRDAERPEELGAKAP